MALQLIWKFCKWLQLVADFYIKILCLRFCNWLQPRLRPPELQLFSCRAIFNNKLVNYVRSMSVLGLYLFIFCISINVISDQQKILIYRETVIFFFSTGFIIFFTIYDLCTVIIIIIINLLSIYIIKNQRLTNISHKVVVNAESLLYVISNKKYSIIIVSLNMIY